MGEATVLYGGLDLHGDNVFCTLMDAARNVRFEQRFPNDLFTITEGLKPFQKWIKALAVEFHLQLVLAGRRPAQAEVRRAAGEPGQDAGEHRTQGRERQDGRPIPRKINNQCWSNWNFT